MYNYNDKFNISSLFFYNRIYLNGKQILLKDESFENLNHFLDELFKIKEESQLKEKIPQKIKSIFGKILPEDSELLNIEEIEEKNIAENKPIYYYDYFFPIYNFFSPSLYSKINKEPSLLKISGLKILYECKKFKVFEYQHSKNFEKEFNDFMAKDVENKKTIEKSFYSIVLVGLSEHNYNFRTGFLNFLFDVNEDDNYRLAFKEKNIRDDCFISIKFIESQKGNFILISINVDIKDPKCELLEFLKTIEKETINLIIFNIYEADYIPYLEINELEKNEIFFACPSISFNILKWHVFDKEFKLNEKLRMENEHEVDEKLFKETILQMIIYDEIIRKKYNFCYFNYKSISNEEKNKDIFFKYEITMNSYKYFYNIIINRKKNFIDFSSLVEFTPIAGEKEIEKSQKKNIFDEKKGELWVEYHLYEIKIKNLLKEKEKKKLEGYDLKKQMKDESSDYDNKINSINNEIDNLRFYKTIIQEDSSFLLPVSSEKIGNKSYEGNYTHVCQICKYNCHIKCDEMISKFCKCFKFSLFGLKCKECPNKCYSDSHEVVRYQYPKYEYKKLDDILKPYFKGEYPQKISNKSKIDKSIKIKEEEKRVLTEKYEKKKNNLNILIKENNDIIKSQEEAIEITEEKKKEIYDKNKRQLNKEINKIDNELNQLKEKKLKAFEKLLVSCLESKPFDPRIFSSPNKCC